MAKAQAREPAWRRLAWVGTVAAAAALLASAICLWRAQTLPPTYPDRGMVADVLDLAALGLAALAMAVGLLAAFFSRQPWRGAAMACVLLGALLAWVAWQASGI